MNATFASAGHDGLLVLESVARADLDDADGAVGLRHPSSSISTRTCPATTTSPSRTRTARTVPAVGVANAHLDLHRLQHHHRISGRNVVALGDVDRAHVRRHRRGERSAGRRQIDRVELVAAEPVGPAAVLRPAAGDRDLAGSGGSSRERVPRVAIGDRPSVRTPSGERRRLTVPRPLDPVGVDARRRHVGVAEDLEQEPEVRRQADDLASRRARHAAAQARRRGPRRPRSPSRGAGRSRT